ncbi:MAG TPA: universal stress protein [Acidimicrobiales bacterium]|nr:universal stress protein [Acidimicrobiales bacterium]
MSPIRTIAVGIDGSPDAEAALRWAAGLARSLGARLVVVHAAGLLEHAGGGAGPSGLEGTARRLTAEEGLGADRVEWYRSDGDPCTVLLRSTEPPVAADVLVVGSRGRGKHAGLLLGSTSLQLAEHASVPVVIVPTGERAAE